jgi:hypothetical protein
MGYPQKAQDRPRRLPSTDLALHRTRTGILVRAIRSRADPRVANGCHSLRHRGRRTRPCRRALHLRRFPWQLRASRPALQALAVTIREADSSHLGLSPQSSGGATAAWARADPTQRHRGICVSNGMQRRDFIRSTGLVAGTAAAASLMEAPTPAISTRLNFLPMAHGITNVSGACSITRNGLSWVGCGEP